ncbi:hypothetical protein NON20_21015 [Synechocystis sp. B12]|nr:hypothetical protein NON20_21015 [Synechocystis sp. B12]
MESQPQQGGLKQYEIAVQELTDYLDRLKIQQATLEISPNVDPAPIQAVIAKNQKTLNQIQINLGLLQYAENQTKKSLDTWQSVMSNGEPNQQEIATVLIALEESQPVPPMRRR